MFQDNVNPTVDNSCPRWPFGILFDNRGEVPPAAPAGDPPPAPPAAPPADPPPAEPMVPAMTWKDNLGTDLRNSPLMEKFEDSADGLNKAFESHANLESLLGHEKVPIPKGPEDVEGWNRFSKAMGIPDKAENYGLADAKLPESMQDMTMNKQKFAEVVHAHKLTPSQAKGLWEVYQSENISAYNGAMDSHKAKMAETVNQLKSEWGDTYDVNVELGQTVINKFSSDQEANDFLTSVLANDPRGVKFLAKIGEQFAEGRIPEFQMQRFSLAPEEAQGEIDKMVHDMDGAYMNVGNKFTQKEHDAAIDRVNSLRALINKAKGQA